MRNITALVLILSGVKEADEKLIWEVKLRTIFALAISMRRLASNPKTRTRLFMLLQEVDPKVVVTEDTDGWASIKRAA